MNAVTKKEESNVTRLERERDYILPAVNIFELDDGYVLEADMPGVSKDGLEVTLEGNVLTIIGHRKDQEETKATLLYGETRTADYQRTFELDPSLDTAKINAKIDQGLLVVRLPKPEKVKPRKIEVAAG